jgi:hypothetical protein
MRYITIKRYRHDGIGGHFNLPYGTAVEKKDGMLYYDNRPICVARSYSSHEHFARDDDGQGLARGKLSHEIIKALGGTHYEGEPTPGWNAIEGDEIAESYRRKDLETSWFWNDSFYNAPIEDLLHIAGLVGIKKEV